MKEQTILAKKMSALLDLNRKPVGVKLVYSKEEYDIYDARELVAPLEYCVSVKSAGLGNSIKFVHKNSGCGGSTCALGFQPPADEFYDGRQGCRLGLFKDPAVAEKTNSQVSILKKPLYGVIVKPLEDFTETEPDVVIIVAAAREVMRLLQGYTCTYGLQPRLAASGNQAICVECTAYPMLTGDMNLSMLCSGTRYLAKWKDSEAAIGIPYAKFGGLVEGVRNSSNGTEPDNRKAEIIEKLKELECDTADLVYGDAYYIKLKNNKK